MARGVVALGGGGVHGLALPGGATKANMHPNIVPTSKTHATRWRAALVAAALSGVTLPAHAASDVRAEYQSLAKTSVSHALSVLGSNEICDSGCRYQAEDVEKEVRLAYRNSPNDYFKWTNLDDTRFFTHVTISRRGEVTRVNMRVLDDERDAALVRELEQKTKLPHETVLDAGESVITLTPEGKQTRVNMSALARVSGILEVFSGKVKSRLELALHQTARNFER